MNGSEKTWRHRGKAQKQELVLCRTGKQAGSAEEKGKERSKCYEVWRARNLGATAGEWH